MIPIMPFPTHVYLNPVQLLPITIPHNVITNCRTSPSLPITIIPTPSPILRLSFHLSHTCICNNWPVSMVITGKHYLLMSISKFLGRIISQKKVMPSTSPPDLRLHRTYVSIGPTSTADLRLHRTYVLTGPTSPPDLRLHRTYVSIGPTSSPDLRVHRTYQPIHWP